jgi:hypothetical protein
MSDYPLLRVGILLSVLGIGGFFLWQAFGGGIADVFQVMRLEDGTIRTSVKIGTQRETIEINGHEIEVEIADTPEKTVLGLSGRESLGENEGMLFLFSDTRTHVFWMFDMNFPLDIIWIRDGVVVEIVENAPAPVGGEAPTTFIPGQVANAVLELNAGKAQELGIKVGSEISF